MSNKIEIHVSLLKPKTSTIFYRQSHAGSAGFTLMEMIVGIAIFAILVSAMFGVFAVLTQTTRVARAKTEMTALAESDMEIVRNMPYSQVGTLQGNPHGPLPDYPNAVSQTIEGIPYQYYYKVMYVHDPADTATGTPDYKQVKMSIINERTGQGTDFVTTVAPNSLITNPNSGALQLSVIDSQGNPLPNASVEIRYPTTSPYTYDLFDTSDSSGQVVEVGLPAGVNAYRIIATKGGYSTDQTYPITAQNPNPVKPDATVAVGKITQVSFSIDTLAQLTLNTENDVCQAQSGVGLNVSGTKLIGTNPNILKFNQNYTSSGGTINLSDIEWDTYTPQLLTGQNYVVYGTSPIQKISVLPGTSQTFSMIVGPNSTNQSLLVIVKDVTNQTAVENAAITLTPQSTGQAIGPLYTGGSVWLQNDWSGGSGVSDWSSSTVSSYNQDDGHINNSNTPTGISLVQAGSVYAPSGWLESSSFDTGTSGTNYTILSWEPTSQASSTSIKFQVAANNDDQTWNYIGPDGTANTYFTTPGQDMGSSIDGNRYIRYKVYLSTSNTAVTPVLTSVNLNFVTGCYTPGQVIFTGLSAGAYNLNVSAAGYTSQNITGLNIQANQTEEVDLSQ